MACVPEYYIPAIVSTFLFVSLKRIVAKVSVADVCITPITVKRIVKEKCVIVNPPTSNAIPKKTYHIPNTRHHTVPSDDPSPE